MVRRLQLRLHHTGQQFPGCDVKHGVCAAPYATAVIGETPVFPDAQRLNPDLRSINDLYDNCRVRTGVDCRRRFV
jgi:hypothetical protein